MAKTFVKKSKKLKASDSPQITFNHANFAYRAQQWEDALALYEQALALESGLELAALQRARCLVQLQRWVQAREAFAQTLRINNGNYSAWLEVGHLCRQLGELQQAQAGYQKAMTLAPERYEAPLGLARVLELQGDAEGGAQAYLKAQQAVLQSNAPTRLREVHVHMGRYRLERGDAQAALPCLSTALQVAQRVGADVNVQAEVKIDLGEALLRLGHQNAGLQVLTEASAATHEPTLARLGALAFRHNLWQEGLAVLRKCVDLFPQSPMARWNLAHLLAECWQMDEALQVLQDAEQLGAHARRQKHACIHCRPSRRCRHSVAPVPRVGG